MLLYIDYLDHIISGDYNFDELKKRLRFDLLLFARNNTLCISTPACIKLRDTTNLLMQITPFWKDSKIVLQLDQKHKLKASNYFEKRKRILSKSLPEEKLINHFEFKAYENKRTHIFFDEYLPDYASVTAEKLYINKINDTDALFRKDSVLLFEKHLDVISSTLEVSRIIEFGGIVNRIIEMALNKSDLYQRSIIEDRIKEEFEPKHNEMLYVTTLLDRAFALANAGSSNAVPISLVLNQLTGKWLVKFLLKSYKPLFDAICSMEWEDVYNLCYDPDWINFIACINAFIFISQEEVLKKQNFRIDYWLNRLSGSVVLVSLLKLAKSEAITATKSKLYSYGFFSEAQNLEVIGELMIDMYAGRHKVFFDVVCSIDIFANRLMDKLINNNLYTDLMAIGNKQTSKSFDILE